jgi:hypothetical protein
MTKGRATTRRRHLRATAPLKRVTIFKILRVRPNGRASSGRLKARLGLWPGSGLRLWLGLGRTFGRALAEKPSQARKIGKAKGECGRDDSAALLPIVFLDIAQP